MPTHRHTRSDLARLAVQAMLERGLKPEFGPQVDQQLSALHAAPQDEPGAKLADLRRLLWCSIDNDDSRDLDQLSVSEPLAHGGLRVYVAVADVDALVKQDGAIDAHAQANTISVYTSARIFPMLPERLSTDLTSLNPGVDRLAMVTQMDFDAQGGLKASNIYQAKVHNHSQLAYDAVSAWLEGQAPLPAAAAAVPGMDAQLHAQDALAQQLRRRRHEAGSLDFETLQPRALFDGEHVVDIRQQEHNRARQLIEELMVAANGCTARFLAAHGLASLRRVVRSPERWLRIVKLAQQYGEALPELPDAKALETFLARRRKADPLRFPDLSLTIVKLMGAGEYVVETPGAAPIGHFGLAVRDYTHATAPNRRYPDLITSRLLKSVLRGTQPPYASGELGALALHCTQQEDAAKKVERQLRKSEAALLLETRLGQRFDAVVTGSGDKGVWVRIFTPPAEGRLLDAPAERFEVGDKLRVKLVSTNVERGFIDFVPQAG
jgi:exoribonuclease-2